MTFLWKLATSWFHLHSKVLQWKWEATKTLSDVDTRKANVEAIDEMFIYSSGLTNVVERPFWGGYLCSVTHTWELYHLPCFLGEEASCCTSIPHQIKAMLCLGSIYSAENITTACQGPDCTPGTNFHSRLSLLLLFEILNFNQIFNNLLSLETYLISCCTAWLPIL